MTAAGTWLYNPALQGWRHEVSNLPVGLLAGVPMISDGPGCQLTGPCVHVSLAPFEFEKVLV